MTICWSRVKPRRSCSNGLFGFAIDLCSVCHDDNDFMPEVVNTLHAVEFVLFMHDLERDRRSLWHLFEFINDVLHSRSHHSPPETLQCIECCECYAQRTEEHERGCETETCELKAFVFCHTAN